MTMTAIRMISATKCCNNLTGVSDHTQRKSMHRILTCTCHKISSESLWVRVLCLARGSRQLQYLYKQPQICTGHMLLEKATNIKMTQTGNQLHSVLKTTVFQTEY
jgi:hypothetical protein